MRLIYEGDEGNEGEMQNSCGRRYDGLSGKIGAGRGEQQTFVVERSVCSCRGGRWGGKHVACRRNIWKELGVHEYRTTADKFDSEVAALFGYRAEVLDLSRLADSDDFVFEYFDAGPLELLLGQFDFVYRVGSNLSKVCDE